MARIGINPAREKVSSYKPERVTVAMLTYLPHLEGYFRSRFDILKISLASLFANTSAPYDLLVFDNGSCVPVVEYLTRLKSEGWIDFLLLSGTNIGKIGAFRLIFGAAPGDLVAYADDDIFFYPGWLEAHLSILDTYPKVGMVSGSPVRDAAERARSSLYRFIDDNRGGLSVSRERRIPDQWEIDWAVSVGRDPQAYLVSTVDQPDLILTYRGVEAFGSASHFQFLAPKDVILRAIPEEWSGRLMGEMIQLDEAVDGLGYLRLSTVERTTRHLGNTISPDVIEDARGVGIKPDAKPFSSKPGKHWMMRLPGSRRLLSRFYDYLFRLLHNVD